MSIPVFISTPISRTAVAEMAHSSHGILKAAVDCHLKKMAIGGHSDLDPEKILVSHGSKKADIWGMQLHPVRPGRDWIQFESAINVKPLHNNVGRKINSLSLQEQIRLIVTRCVH